eukprot:scpid43781/ scgid34997/ 
MMGCLVVSGRWCAVVSLPPTVSTVVPCTSSSWGRSFSNGSLGSGSLPDSSRLMTLPPAVAYSCLWTLDTCTPRYTRKLSELYITPRAYQKSFKIDLVCICVCL